MRALTAGRGKEGHLLTTIGKDKPPYELSWTVGG